MMLRLPVLISCLMATFALPLAAQTQGVLREVWTSIDGNSIASLTLSPNYPASPILRVVAPDFRSPADWNDRYGVRMRAFLTPTATANYTFWVSGDDNCELWLSPDADPAHRVRIATVPSHTVALTWNTFAEQRSAAVNLQAGQRYYVEALMKEGSGGDSLAVAWATSPDATPQVIPGANLTPFEIPPPTNGTVVVNAGNAVSLYSPNASVVLTAQALDLSKPTKLPTLAWSQISGATASIVTPAVAATRIDLPSTGTGTYVFRATGTTTAGVTGTDEVTVTVLPKLASDAGSALAEYWFGASGATVASMSNSLDYPNFPHAHRVVTSLTSPTSLGDQFGERTRGFILPPTTGSYRFYVSGNDAVEFLLSTDASPANLQVRASANKSMGSANDFANPAQDSGVIQLTAGQRYAFEVRRKDESGSDAFSVLWLQPGVNYLTDITGEFLAPPADKATAMAATQVFDPALDFALNAGRDQVIHLPRTRIALNAYETRRVSGADTPVREWKQVSGPAGVQFSSAATAATTATFPKAGTYLLRYSVTTTRNTTSDDVKVEVRAAINANTGYLTRQVWWNRNYASIAAMQADTAFPNSPDLVDNVSELRQSNDWANQYGTRITGILNVPAGGTAPVNYTFYVAGDDVAEFSISTDTTPGKLQRICHTTKASGREVWTAEASQTSVPVALKPGGKYLVELLHKETWSSDYFAVAWSKEGDRRPVVIDGAYFEPVIKSAPFESTRNSYASAGRDRTYYWPHDRARLAGTVIKVLNSSATPTTSWKLISGPKATIADPTRLDSEVSLSGVGTYTFELTVTEGTVIHRDTVAIQVLPTITGVTGYLTRSVWIDVGGSTLADLTAYDATLSYPHFEDLLPGVESPPNWTDYYGTRLKGYLTVPTSGAYTFWIASDDASELKLDLGDGNGLQRIAYLTYAVGVRAWDSYAIQKSATFNLQAGVRYPMEALQKEGGGDDHLSIALSGPATNGREVLSRGFLSPDHSAPIFNPEITVTLGSDRTLLWPTNSLVLAALVYDLKQGPSALTYKWSSTSTKVTFESPSSPVSGVKFSGPGVYEVKVTASDGSNSGSDTLLVTVRNPLNTKSGGILREAWTGVSGYYLSDLRSSAAYAGKPKFTDVLSNFEAPTNWGDNYGQRLTGYLQVPTEGDYVFLLASDDESELWFNPAGDSPAGIQKIAFTTYGTGRYNWTRYPSQQSAVLRLVPGKRYYIQALHKEGTSEDCLAVAYRLASQPNSAAVVIPGVMLSPPDGTTAAAFDGQLSVRAGDPQSGVWPRSRYTLRGIAVDYVPGPQALAYRWSVISAPSGAASKVIFNSPTALTTDVELPQAGSYQLQLTATDGLGTRSDTLTITLAPPLAAGTGSLLAETFKGITGSWVTDLVKSPKFPNSPDDRVRIKTAEIPSNQGDNYGMLIRGYLYPPATGIYRLNLASDEWSEVWLSTDRTPELKELACFVPSATDYYEWRKFPEYQLSRPIKLEKGKSYYLEIRYKESGWRDHLSLAWLKPGSTAFEVIDGAYLAPWLLPDAQPPTISLTGGSSVTLEVGQSYTDPGFTATDLIDGNVNSRVTTEGTVDTSTPGTYIIRYTVRDASGNPTVVTRQVDVVVAAGAAPVYPADASGAHSTAPWTPPATLSDAEVARFLKQATFGPNDADIARVKQIGFAAWIDEQLALPPTLHLPHMDRIASYQTAKNNLISLARTADTLGLPGSTMPMAASLSTDDRLWTWWTHAITAPDQLRQRVAFALSEVLVISDKSGTLRNYPRGCTNYYDLLVKRIAAGSTYRDLLEDVTFNPMMGTWLTMIRSSKARPDENYPREIMQLFSIGLEHLNKDGTFKRDAQGNAIPSYGQNEILELSRAFTGWTYGKSPAFTWSNGADETNPMMSFEDYHDRGRKTILGGATIPAGQTALQDVRKALDIIAAHPNVGPFIAKRLIQRLVTSNPSPAYIYRVASKWDNNGKGIRGDLCAVTKAILLDPEARAAGNVTTAGKLSEPILRLSRLLRAFATPPSDNPPVLGRYLMWNADEDLGQWPMQAPTVFNFFHTDYKPTGPIMDAGLNAPEFEITTELTTVDTSNYFYEGTVNGFYTNSGPRAVMNYASLTSLWATPDALFNRLENLLLGRPMSASVRSSLMALHTLHSASPTQGIRAIMQVITSSPEFSVDR